MDYSDYTTKSTKILQDELREHFNRVVFFSDSTQKISGPESWGHPRGIRVVVEVDQFFPTTGKGHVSSDG